MTGHFHEIIISFYYMTNYRSEKPTQRNKRDVKRGKTPGQIERITERQEGNRKVIRRQASNFHSDIHRRKGFQDIR